MNKFFAVWAEGTGSQILQSDYCRVTIHRAAEKLAADHPGTTYYVGEVYAEVTVPRAHPVFKMLDKEKQ